MTWRLLPWAVRVKCTGWPALWLPLFVLWPLIFAVFCLLLPVCLVLPGRARSALGALRASYDVLCAIHGAEVEVGTTPHGSWRFSLH
jgi:hypothetical protein